MVYIVVKGRIWSRLL